MNLNADPANYGRAPHCDSRVLHAPGECWACDLYPQWQEARQVQGVAFTGHEPDEGEVFDPAGLYRTDAQINAWPGNRAEPTRPGAS